MAPDIACRSRRRARCSQPHSTARLKGAEFRTDPNFGFEVPISVPGVDGAILDPRSTWPDKDAYDRQATKLVDMFISNFAKFERHVDASVRGASPRILQAAE